MIYACPVLSYFVLRLVRNGTVLGSKPSISECAINFHLYLFTSKKVDYRFLITRILLKIIRLCAINIDVKKSYTNTNKHKLNMAGRLHQINQDDFEYTLMSNHLQVGI